MRHALELAAAAAVLVGSGGGRAATRPSRAPQGGVSAVIRQVMPAVVRIHGREAAGFRGVGAGVVLTADGVIVTHVSNVVGTERPTVVFRDGRKLDAQVVGVDSGTEMAVLRVKARGLPTLKFADSAAVRPGQWVLAIGNPFGLARDADDDLSANLGVITAYSQVRASGFKYQGFVFLTDAQINPGSYGGALVDLSGNLVALNGRVVTSQDTNTQMAVAIPVNDVYPAVVRILREAAQAAASRPTTTTRPVATLPAGG